MNAEDGKDLNGLPEHFLKRMREELGEEFEEFIDSMQKLEVKALRRNPAKTEEEFFERPAFPSEKGTHSEGRKASFAECWEMRSVPWEPCGFYYRAESEACGTGPGLPAPMPPGKHPYHEAGAYYIQEPSAMAPVAALEPEPGERILDLCAAPGGKSTQIASYMDHKGLLVCNEPHPARAKILSQNIERMGIRNALVISEDPTRLSLRLPGFFDRILVDAPCSGEGMFRRSRTAVSEWSPENVRACALRQADILDAAAVMLKEGGRLVYSTCTFGREEDEKTAEAFVSRHNYFMLTKMEKLYPHRVEGEGHFLAVFQREGVLAAHKEAATAGKRETGGRRKKVAILEKTERESFEDFLRETVSTGILKEGREDRLLRFADNLYLMPEGMPDLNGLKVLRAGLQLGCLKKGRFEPAHALALTLRAEDSLQSYDMPSDGEEIRQYLSGQTIAVAEAGSSGQKVMSTNKNGAAAEKEERSLKSGWVLMTVDGLSIGWAKCAGGILKNHYPKGLRINY